MPLVMLAMVVPAGIPPPLTACPSERPEVSATVTVVLPATRVPVAETMPPETCAVPEPSLTRLPCRTDRTVEEEGTGAVLLDEDLGVGCADLAAEQGRIVAVDLLDRAAGEGEDVANRAHVHDLRTAEASKVRELTERVLIRCSRGAGSPPFHWWCNRWRRCPCCPRGCRPRSWSCARGWFHRRWPFRRCRH